jgi:hypothetical protein
MYRGRQGSRALIGQHYDGTDAVIGVMAGGKPEEAEAVLRRRYGLCAVLEQSMTGGGRGFRATDWREIHVRTGSHEKADGWEEGVAAGWGPRLTSRGMESRLRQPFRNRENRSRHETGIEQIANTRNYARVL